jgi:diacylglycerol kinase
MKQYIESRLKSFQFAFSGIYYIIKSQPNSWIHLVATVAVVLFGIWLGLSRIEWVLLVLTLGIIWAAEAINTALEAIVDLISPHHNPLAKIAKDVSAASVLILAMMSVLVGLILLGPPLLVRITSWFQ